MFNRAAAKIAMATAKEALESAFKDSDIVVQKFSGSFGDTLRLTVTLDQASSDGTNTNERAFTQLAAGYGLDPDWLGKTFKQRQTTYTITGLNPSRPKYPVSVVSHRGKGFKFPASLVKSLMTGVDPWGEGDLGGP